jgi:[acyl-carrier-protein] S-malonyltransferase
MTAYVFPGQGAQFEGMGKDLHEAHLEARELFQMADEIMGFSLSAVMFDGNAEDLKQTKVTQPAIFLHSIVKVKLAGSSFRPDCVAGHSLGEFSALVAAGALSFAEGLNLVRQRALAMQKACEMTDSTMAAILGLDDEVVEEICGQIDELVVPANYNSPGQLVISGARAGVEAAIERLTQAGAKRAVLLPVGGAFHSPLMQPAQDELAAAIANTSIAAPRCPIYQNVDAMPHTDPEAIKKNLIAQLTAPVRWSQTLRRMIDNGVSAFVEVGGTGKVLQGMIKKIDRDMPTSSL